MTEIVNSAFFVAGNEVNIEDAPDLLTAIAKFYETKGAFTQKAIQGQLDEMKGDQRKMELINQALAYYRAANSAKDGDTFTVDQSFYGYDNSLCPVRNGSSGRAANARSEEGHTVNGAIRVTITFDSPSDSDTKKNQAKLDTLKSQLDTMNNTSQLKMLSLNKYMDNLSTITSTAANGQKVVGDMNAGIAQKM